MTHWHLCRATADDATALAACIDAAYAHYAARISDLPAVSEGIGDEIAAHRVWLCEMDGKIAGGIVLVPQDGHLLLVNVAVHPDFAGKGLGGALMAQADTDCRALGLAEVRLSTHVKLPENVTLYAHLGWEETSRKGNKVNMRKQL